MRILFIGDVVGAPGRKAVTKLLPGLRLRWGLDLVICNAENAAGGSGLTIGTHDELAGAGVDIFTLGDHAFRKDEVFTLFERRAKICRPANYALDSPGAELVMMETAEGWPVAVFTVLGRTFMTPVDCPLRAADRILARIGTAVKLIFVDIHAEATSEKQLLGRYLDGRATAVLGTHTHVPTADETVFPGGTAFQCDVGMTGPYDSIIGRRYDRVLAATLTHVYHHFEVAHNDARLCGSVMEVDPHTGKALAIHRVNVPVNADLSSFPAPWDDNSKSERRELAAP